MMSDTLTATLQQASSLLPAKVSLTILSELAWIRASLEQNHDDVCRLIASQCQTPYEDIRKLFGEALEASQASHFQRLLRHIGCESGSDSGGN